MNNNPKSATVAGLLGIFLGGVGAHNWYLGDKKKGIIHVGLLSGAILLMLIADAILPAVLSLSMALSMAGLILFLNGLAGMIISGNSLWGLIEGIMILAKGDAGLAERGIPTAGVPVAQQPTVQPNWQNGANTMGQMTGTQSMQSTGTASQAAGTGVQTGGTQAGGVQAGGVQAGGVQTAGVQMTAQVKPPKQPMDPAKKRKIIKGAVIGIAAVVLVTVAVIVTAAMLKVNYGEAYRVAKELKPEVVAVYQNTACTRVVDYAESTYTKPADYNEYADNCLSAGSEIGELLGKLGETAGVKRNKEIKEQYDKFNEGVNSVLPDREELEAKLNLYKAWHEFVYLSDGMKHSSPDSTVQAAVAPLVNSGNATLKAYGEGWQEKVLAITQAYREYNNLTYYDDNKSTARVKYQDAQANYNNWVAANKPDIKQLGGLNFDNNTKMYNEWTKLYNLIRDTYEENYESDSGDCSELFGEVYCD